MAPNRPSPLAASRGSPAASTLIPLYLPPPQPPTECQQRRCRSEMITTRPRNPWPCGAAAVQQHTFDLALNPAVALLRGRSLPFAAPRPASHVPAQPRRRLTRVAPVAAVFEARRRIARVVAGPAARNISVVPTTGRPLPHSSKRSFERGGGSVAVVMGPIRRHTRAAKLRHHHPRMAAAARDSWSRWRDHLTARANGRPPRATSPRHPGVRPGSGTVAPYVRRCPTPPAQGLLSRSKCRC